LNIAKLKYSVKENIECDAKNILSITAQKDVN